MNFAEFEKKHGKHSCIFEIKHKYQKKIVKDNLKYCEKDLIKMENYLIYLRDRVLFYKEELQRKSKEGENK